MIFYHVTRPAAAEQIRRRGFKESRRHFGPIEVRGVWLSDRPWNGGGYIAAESVDDVKLSAITVQLDGRRVRKFEIVNDDCPYREWCVPMAIVNAALGVKAKDLLK